MPKPTHSQMQLIQLLTDVAQLLDGWHNDGTAWSEWDESVRQRVSVELKVLYDAVPAPIPSEGCAECGHDRVEHYNLSPNRCIEPFCTCTGFRAPLCFSAEAFGLASPTAEGPQEGLEAMEWLKANRILELDDEYPELPHGKEQFIRIRFPHAVEAIDLDREENGDPQYAERYLGFWQEHLADLLTAYANAALERAAAQIAEEHRCRHIACDCEETMKRIAAEIRKLAKP